MKISSHEQKSKCGYLPCYEIAIAPIILFGIILVTNVHNKNTGACFMNVH